MHRELTVSSNGSYLPSNHPAFMTALLCLGLGYLAAVYTSRS